jgi:TRAP-type mannitol/chloroaromatic compound transport system permease large subunit
MMILEIAGVRVRTTLGMTILQAETVETPIHPRTVDAGANLMTGILTTVGMIVETLRVVGIVGIVGIVERVATVRIMTTVLVGTLLAATSGIASIVIAGRIGAATVNTTRKEIRIANVIGARATTLMIIVEKTRLPGIVTKEHVRGQYQCSVYHNAISCKTS